MAPLVLLFWRGRRQTLREVWGRFRIPSRRLSSRCRAMAGDLAMGLTGAKDNTALAKAFQLMLLEKNTHGVALDDDDVRGLGGMSMGRSLMETFLEITRPDVERQLALQNEAASPPPIE